MVKMPLKCDVALVWKLSILAGFTPLIQRESLNGSLPKNIGKKLKMLKMLDINGLQQR